MEDFEYLQRLQNRGLPAHTAREKRTEKQTQQVSEKANDARSVEEGKDNIRKSKGRKARKDKDPKVEDTTDSKEPSVHPVLHTDFKKAYEGVLQTLIDKCKSEEQCSRCGLKYHSWKKCRRDNPVTVSGLGKRQREAGDVGNKETKRPATKQTPKVSSAAVKVSGGKTTRVSSALKERNPPSIWQLDDTDDDFSLN